MTIAALPFWGFRIGEVLYVIRIRSRDIHMRLLKRLAAMQITMSFGLTSEVHSGSLQIYIWLIQVNTLYKKYYSTCSCSAGVHNAHMLRSHPSTII